MCQCWVDGRKKNCCLIKKHHYGVFFNKPENYSIVYCMVKSYKSQSFFDGLKFSFSNTLRQNKWKVLVSVVCVLVAIFTGVFVAIKAHNNFNLGSLREINLDSFYSGVAVSSSAFLSRTFSLLVNILILTGLAFVPALFVLAEVLLVYRGYLFGLNFALIFIFYGIGACVTAVVVVLPCQLMTLFVLLMYYIVFSKLNQNRKKFGRSDCNRILFVVIAIVAVLLINLAETLLLCLLNGKVILVI